MIVDDEMTNLKLLSTFFKINGYTNKLIIVQDSRLVVSKYQEYHPILILLDIKMPYLDGYEVMLQLRKLNDPLLPPIVVLTAFDDKDNLQKIQESSAADFLIKPLEFNELSKILCRLLDSNFNELLKILRRLPDPNSIRYLSKIKGLSN